MKIRMRSHLYQLIKRPEDKQVARDRAVVVVPVAVIEQHDYHLPVEISLPEDCSRAIYLPVAPIAPKMTAFLISMVVPELHVSRYSAFHLNVLTLKNTYCPS